MHHYPKRTFALGTPSRCWLTDLENRYNS
ncbi:YsgD/CorL family protein [Erwinia tracheiphila]